MRNLTAAGFACWKLRAVDERPRMLSDEIDASSGRRIGNLKLGVVSTAKYFAPRLMTAFQKQHPGI